MKNLLKLSLAFLAVVLIGMSANAQSFTITNGGGCSSGNSNSINVGPGAGGGNIYPVGTSGSCEIVNLTGPLVNQYTLWKLVSGSWTSASSPNVSVKSFTGLAPGTYKVTGQFPQQVSSACPGGYIKIDNYLGQWIGYGGNYGATETSNTISIGAPSTADIKFTFVKDAEYTGPHSPANASNFDPTGDVTINTTGTSVAITAYQVDGWEYDQYGNYLNWWGTGWISGQAPTTLDLSRLLFHLGAGVYPNWVTGHQYQVQFCISDNPCGTPTYEQVFVPFYICPSGDGCEMTDVNTPISISPNPASASFRLNNVLFTPGTEYHLTLTDMSGRVVREYNNVSEQAQTYNISDISTGLYVASLWNGTAKVFTNKLSIAK